MKKTPSLNSPLSQFTAGLGHGDMLVIADAGLPIPARGIDRNAGPKGSRRARTGERQPGYRSDNFQPPARHGSESGVACRV